MPLFAVFGIVSGVSLMVELFTLAMDFRVVFIKCYRWILGGTAITNMVVHILYLVLTPSNYSIVSFVATTCASFVVLALLTIFREEK